MVRPYRPDYEPKEIPIVHAAVQYDCPYTGERYILVIRNALHVPEMMHNLMPPFVMRETGIQVCDTPKIHTVTPNKGNHAIYFSETDFRIPLQLWGIFSYFNTSRPSTKTMIECDEIYIVTPKNWDPHTDAYERNEGSMLDYKGELIPKKRGEVLLSKIKVSANMESARNISAAEEGWINEAFNNLKIKEEEDPRPEYMEIPQDIDKVAGILSSINPNLVDGQMTKRMHERAKIGTIASAIGLLKTSNTPFILEEKPRNDYWSIGGEENIDDNDEAIHEADNPTVYVDDEDEIIDELLEDVLVGAINIDKIMAASAGKSKGIRLEHL